MIRIICLGKIKEQYLNDLINDYKKRINKYHKLEIIELKDENNLSTEKDSIMKYLSRKDFNIALDIKGHNLTSIELANKISETFNSYPNINFIIGSSEGLHEDIKSYANYLLSFSSLTFPHGLFRGILLEQIYRAFKIINNETYHK